MAPSFANAALALCLSALCADAIQLSSLDDGCSHCVQGTTGDLDGCFYSPQHQACTNARATHFCKVKGSTFTAPVRSCPAPPAADAALKLGGTRAREMTKNPAGTEQEKKKKNNLAKKARLVGREVAGTGDPHMTNAHGEHFDLMQPGRHTLLLVPMGAQPETTLLRVDADAKREGRGCADMYFKAINVTGSWVRRGPKGLQYFAGGKEHKHREILKFGNFGLKLVWGRTSDDVEYLNVFAKPDRSLNVPLGGLLGEDDYTDAATPSKLCKQSVALISESRVDREQDRSRAGIADEHDF